MNDFFDRLETQKKRVEEARLNGIVPAGSIFEADTAAWFDFKLTLAESLYRDMPQEEAEALCKEWEEAVDKVVGQDKSIDDEIDYNEDYDDIESLNELIEVIKDDYGQFISEVRKREASTGPNLTDLHQKLRLAGVVVPDCSGYRVCFGNGQEVDVSYAFDEYKLFEIASIENGMVVDDSVHSGLSANEVCEYISEISQMPAKEIPSPAIEQPAVPSIYVVQHVYDVDGGFGDAVRTSEVLGYFANKKDAEEYVARYSKPRVYDTPYANLYEHTLEIEELKALDKDINPFPLDCGQDINIIDFQLPDRAALASRIKCEKDKILDVFTNNKGFAVAETTEVWKGEESRRIYAKVPVEFDAVPQNAHQGDALKISFTFSDGGCSDGKPFFLDKSGEWFTYEEIFFEGSERNISSENELLDILEQYVPLAFEHLIDTKNIDAADGLSDIEQ